MNPVLWRKASVQGADVFSSAELQGWSITCGRDSAHPFLQGPVVDDSLLVRSPLLGPEQTLPGPWYGVGAPSSGLPPPFQPGFLDRINTRVLPECPCVLSRLRALLEEGKATVPCLAERLTNELILHINVSQRVGL